MFRSLNARLLLSHIFVILVCLVLVGLGVLVFVRTSPLWIQAGLRRLEEAERTTMQLLLQKGPLETLPQEQLYALLTQAAEEENARILLLDDRGQIQFDSQGEWVGRNLGETIPPRPVPAPRTQGSLTMPNGQRWIYVAQMLPNTERQHRFLVFASPPTRIFLLLWFAENLLPPLLRAGAVALVLSILLAWLAARSVARPLRRVAAAADAIAQGDLEQRAPISGPREVRNLARVFNHMASQVAATQQAQRDLVANVSHELKTPLTSIQGFSQAILDGTADNPEAVERSARVIYDEADRMRRLVNELLNLARFDAGQVQMVQEVVNLSALLTECVERMTPQAEAAGNRIHLSAEEGLTVTGDPDWLMQTLVNLIDNGIRHTQEGEVRVVAHRDGGWVQVTVTDTGEGIPSEDLGRIFERFYQADKSRHRQGSSVGLGLSIARDVVRLHGGEITAESVVGLGSRFIVRLPAAEKPPPPQMGD